MRNLPLLVEFAKTFKGKFAIVKVDNEYVLELEDIAKCFCDPNFNNGEVQYEIIQNLYPAEKKNKANRTRTQILDDAKKIKKQIRDNLLKEKQLNLKQIKTNFEELEVTDACLSNHFTKVRKELESEGYVVLKLSNGTYRIEKK